MRKIGAHVSTAGGYLNGVEKAVSIGAGCMQLFSSSPRMWARRPLVDEELYALVQGSRAQDIFPIFTHAMYLLNLAAKNSEAVAKSKEVLKHELIFDSQVSGAGVIVHLGSHMGVGWEAIKEQLVDAIIEVLDQTPENSTLLIENSAGQNGKIASDLKEIRWLIDRVKSSRLGWCLDTCHAFAAGYSFGQIDELNGVIGKKNHMGNLIETIADLELWSTLKCLHVNDSKDIFASGRDRHQNLGDGNIPNQWFKNVLDTEQIQNIPLILEVPGLDDNGPDAANIQRLQQLVKN